MPFNPDKIDRSKYMSRKEAAEELGIPFERVKPLIDNGKLRGLQRGKVWYVERESVKRLKQSGHW